MRKHVSQHTKKVRNHLYFELDCPDVFFGQVFRRPRPEIFRMDPNLPGGNATLPPAFLGLWESHILEYDDHNGDNVNENLNSKENFKDNLIIIIILL